MGCQYTGTCAFYTAVEPSTLKRIKYASAFPYCKGGQHGSCALRERYAAGREVPANLLPSGALGDYMEITIQAGSGGARYIVVEDSPVFMRIAGNIVRNAVPGAQVIECSSYDEACRELAAGRTALVVSGYGLGGGRSAKDLRPLTDAPIVVLTGRPEGEVDAPFNSRVVQKAAGPDALRAAILEFAG